MKTLAFTGHRPAQLGGYDENNQMALKVKQKLRELVFSAYDSGYREFVAGMAMGVDQWACEAVLELKAEHSDVKLTAAVPFATQSSVWFPKSKQAWQDLLKACDEIYVVDSDPEKPVSFDSLMDAAKIPLVATKQTVSKKLNNRNEWMADRADCMLAVWRGTPGGTGNCVQYAKTQGKRIITYNPDDDTVSKF